MTISALPSDTLSQLQRQGAENVRSRVQQTSEANSLAALRLREQPPENRTPDQFSRTVLEARLNELREQREQRLQTRDEARARQLRSNAAQPELQSIARQGLTLAPRRNDEVVAEAQAQRELRVQKSIEQREERQDRVEVRAESIEEQRSRRIRESIEAREVRQQESTQEAVQRREAQQAETDLRIVTEARERARRLQDEAQEALRREAERQRERLDVEANDVVQLQAQPANPAAQQSDEDSALANNVSDTAQAGGVDYSAQEQDFSQESVTNDDTQSTNELIDILREEADIIETLLRQQAVGLTVSEQQMNAELTQVRDSLREEVERNARILQNNLPATSRLGNFIDRIS